MTLDLEAGAALLAAMTPGELYEVSEYPGSRFSALLAGRLDGPGLTFAQWMLGRDAAGIAWLATHRDELLRLARVGQALTPYLDELRRTREAHEAAARKYGYGSGMQAARQIDHLVAAADLLDAYRAATKEKP